MTHCGFQYHPGLLSTIDQRLLMQQIEEIGKRASFFTPKMPRSGRPFSTKMTNCGALGWVSDQAGGYRYQAEHPQTGGAWPPIPDTLLDIWRQKAGYEALPEACLITHYGPRAKMGLHQDRDEEDFTAPVLSFSLGASAQFSLGGVKRAGPKQKIILHSGDLVILGGEARLAFHGIDKILPPQTPRPDTALSAQECAQIPLLAQGGRINLTLRRVSRP